MRGPLSDTHVTFDPSMHACGGIFIQIVAMIFMGAPIVLSLLLFGGRAAAALAVATALPKLLWQSGSPPEGAAFNLANKLYWNLVYPSLFGSPLFVIACCYLRPLFALPILGWWIVFNRFMARPDLTNGSPWEYFSKHDWGIAALR